MENQKLLEVPRDNTARDPVNAKRVAIGLGLCCKLCLGCASSPSTPTPAEPTTTVAMKEVEVSSSGGRIVLTVSGSGRAMKTVDGHVEYVLVESADVDLATKGHEFIFEPVDDKIVDYICALPAADEISVWYGRFAPQQLGRILRRFPRCVIRENLNKI